VAQKPQQEGKTNSHDVTSMYRLYFVLPQNENPRVLPPSLTENSQFWSRERNTETAQIALSGSRGTPVSPLEDSPYFTSPLPVLFFVRSPMPKRILIVEDEISVRHAVRTFLEYQAHLEVCGEAANGVEAMEKATVLRPDLILLDLSMPIMNGVEVASLIRARMPATPVVVYTMFDDVLGKPLAATLGIAAIVSKSDGLTKLLARIDALLASNALVQPPAA
jgi:CheY-like chemotaxis protein